MNWLLVFGIVMSAFGVAEAGWALRTGKRKHLAFQGIGFAAWGAVFIAEALMTREVARVAVMALLGTGALVFLGLGLKFTPRPR